MLLKSIFIQGFYSALIIFIAFNKTWSNPFLAIFLELEVNDTFKPSCEVDF